MEEEEEAKEEEEEMGSRHRELPGSKLSKHREAVADNSVEATIRAQH